MLTFLPSLQLTAQPPLSIDPHQQASSKPPAVVLPSAVLDVSVGTPSSAPISCFSLNQLPQMSVVAAAAGRDLRDGVQPSAASPVGFRAVLHCAVSSFAAGVLWCVLSMF